MQRKIDGLKEESEDECLIKRKGVPEHSSDVLKGSLPQGPLPQGPSAHLRNMEDVSIDG